MKTSLKEFFLFNVISTVYNKQLIALWIMAVIGNT